MCATADCITKVNALAGADIGRGRYGGGAPVEGVARIHDAGVGGDFPRTFYMHHLVLAFIVFYTACAAWWHYQTILLKDMGYSHTVIGILLGAASLAGVAGPLIFGQAADRFGRYKAPMVGGHIAALAAFIPLAFFPNPWMTGLFLLIVTAGINSILPLLDAVTTLAIGPAGNYGKIRTPGTVSFILTVLLLQFIPVLRPNNRYAIVIWSAFFMAFSLVMTLLIPGEYTNIRGRSRPGGKRAEASGGSIWSPLLALGLLIIAFSRLAMSGATGFLSLYAVEALGWDAVGLLNAVSALSEIPFMLFSLPLITRFGAMKCLIAGNLGMFLRLLLLYCFPSPGGVIAAQCMHSLSYGLFHPAAVAYISGCVPPEKRALGMSLYLAVGGTLPGLVGNVLGGFILDHGGFSLLYAVFSGFPLISLALCFVISFNRRR